MVAGGGGGEVELSQNFLGEHLHFCTNCEKTKLGKKCV